jgi:hypothetical protein
MSTPHRATEEQWEIVEICREEGHTPWPTATCLLELRSRVELLERRCEVQLQQLSDLQDRHHRLAGSVRLLEREVFTDAEVPDAPPPDPLTNVTGKGVTVEGSFNQDGTTYVFKTAAQPASAAQPEPPTFQESQARKAHYEAELARRKCEAMRQPAEPAQPAPAVKDSLTTAPAGSLVERVADAMGPSSQAAMDAGELPYGVACVVLRVVADWFRVERDSPETAAALAEVVDGAETVSDGRASFVKHVTQVAIRAMEDRRRQSLRELTDADLLAYARMWGGEVCHPELKRRGLAVPDLEPRGHQPKP